MKKIFITMIAALLCSIGAFAQYAPECKAAIDKIAATNAKFTTVTCPFTQTKHMVMMENELVSKGNLTYTRPDGLKMEYTSPAGDLLEISGDNITMVRGKRTNKISTKTDSRMGNLKNTLLLSVGGDVDGVVKENAAEVQFIETPQYYVFILTKGKGAKSQYVKLELSYSKKDHTLCVMKMEEANGNFTVYDTPVKQMK
ncbi:MAG: outer membrane lipoprotein carrier protein LolA [Bacteroidales bacterium]|nr:outer membrane lipoprotein carrier protein LolA [Bacteroidales bacterium]